MKLITIDCGTHPEDHVFHILLARNKILPLLIPVNSHVKPTNDDPVLKYLYPGLWKFKAMNDDVLEIAALWPGLVLH